VPCGRSNLLSVFFIPVTSTYTLRYVEDQGVPKLSWISYGLSGLVTSRALVVANRPNRLLMLCGFLFRACGRLLFPNVT
jgi:hypothetical protein